MNDKKKKQLMIAVIVGLVIVIIYLLLHKPATTPLAIVSSGTGTGGSTCSVPTNPSNGVTGTCSDGGTYTCQITCTSRPPTTPTQPTTPPHRDCRNLMTSYGANNYHDFTSTIAVTVATDTSCRQYAQATCSYASKIQVVDNCCFWYC